MLDAGRKIEDTVAELERRMSMRVPVSIEAEMLDAGGLRVTYEATDISRHGAFLRLRDRGVELPAVGEIISLRLRWPVETPTPPVTVRAIIVRHEHGGLGVRFLY